jgi:hypothetical protein
VEEEGQQLVLKVSRCSTLQVKGPEAIGLEQQQEEEGQQEAAAAAAAAAGGREASCSSGDGSREQGQGQGRTRRLSGGPWRCDLSHACLLHQLLQHAALLARGRPTQPAPPSLPRLQVWS